MSLKSYQPIKLQTFSFPDVPEPVLPDEVDRIRLPDLVLVVPRSLADVVGHDVSHAGADERELDGERVEVGLGADQDVAEDLAPKLVTAVGVEVLQLELGQKVPGYAASFNFVVMVLLLSFF